MRFQSLFMLTTTQPFFFASSYKTCGPGGERVLRVGNVGKKSVSDQKYKEGELSSLHVDPAQAIWGRDPTRPHIACRYFFSNVNFTPSPASFRFTPLVLGKR